VRSELDARERHGLRLGVAGAVLAFVTLTTVQAVAVRPYLPPDELYHVGYAVTVLDGRLPTLTTPLPTERVPLMGADDRPRRVYVANHPPLFYAVTALPLGLGERVGAPRAGLVAARLLSATLAAGGVVMVAWLAALLPGLPHVSAFVYNDGLGFLAASATLVAVVAVVRRGPTSARLAGLTAAAAALTRAPGLALAALAGAAAAGGVLLHGQRAPARRLLAAAGAGALLGGLAAGSAIGFYLRNRALYGSLTGAAYNQELFRFKPQDHTLDLLLSPAYALRLYDGLWVWTRFNLPRVPTLPALVAVPRMVGLLALAGLAVAASSRLRTHRPPGRDLPALVAWTLALAWPVGVYAMVASYDGNGGHTHPRYLLPGLAVLAVVAAIGLDRLPGARRGLWIAAVTLAQLALTGAAWAGFVTALRGRRPEGPADLLRAVADLLNPGGAGRPWLLLALALARVQPHPNGWTPPSGAADDGPQDAVEEDTGWPGYRSGHPSTGSRPGGTPAGRRTAPTGSTPAGRGRTSTRSTSRRSP
jgi:hypothetical protein